MVNSAAREKLAPLLVFEVDASIHQDAHYPGYPHPMKSSSFCHRLANTSLAPRSPPLANPAERLLVCG